MRTKWTFTATIGAAAIGLCGAVLAPAAMATAETAQETISQLQSRGYTVNIDKIGTAPIDQCTVTSVRNPQTVTQLVPYLGPGRNGNRSYLVPKVTSQTISVSLDCSR